MTEAEWLESSDLFGLLDHARRLRGHRLRTYANFWVEQTRHLLSDELRRQIDEYRARAPNPAPSFEYVGPTGGAGYSVNFAHRTAVEHAADAAAALLRDDWLTAAFVAGRAATQDRVYGPHTAPSRVQFVGRELQLRFWDVADRLVQDQVFSLKCAIGNPFRTLTCAPHWLTSTVLDLARAIEARDFSAMPILADALQDAGCDSEDILSHCRGQGSHVRGCWVIDLLLSKR